MDRITTRGSFNDPIKSRAAFDKNGVETFVSLEDPLPIAPKLLGIGHGVKTVTTAGTDVVLATSTPCQKVDIQAQTDNTGVIAVGSSGVDATVATGTGILLNAGDVYSLEIDDLIDIYIDATVSGEGVRYCYFT